MKISLCAVEQRLNDKVFNMKQIEKYASQEAENGADMWRMIMVRFIPRR